VSLLPIFPLPSVVLFPGALLPLHIFEPRYRAMTADALEGDRRIGMVLLQPGWERGYDGRPPIFPIGCRGVIVRDSRLEDGRYNIVLSGLDRFRILSEEHGRPYRRAAIQAIPDLPLDERERMTLRNLRARLAVMLGPAYQDPLPAMPDADFVHSLAQSLDFEPLEKQALLECENLAIRARALADLLDMKRLSTSRPGAPDVTH
jgi:uncharacterized protein